MTAERPQPAAPGTWPYADWMAAARRQPIGEFYETIIEQAYRDTLRPGDKAVDGGASAGRHTYPMANCVGPRGRVFAFEALPYLAEKLTGKAPPQVSVINKAIGAAVGTASFCWVQGGSGYSGLRDRPAIPADLRSSIRTIDVLVTTIDEETGRAAWVSRLSRPIRFIKLDVEGGEFGALQGARQILLRDKPLVAFENGRGVAADVYGYSKDDWFGFFESINYAVCDLLGRPFLPEQWAANGIPWYFLAAPHGSAAEGYVRDDLPRRIDALFKAWPH